jgi:DNA repair exonuclease SbcCD nuclease subunit
METFFPKLEEEKIDTVLILGDTFDRRKYVNFYTLKRAKDMFFDRLHALGIKVFMLAGNHDTYYKNTNQVNSVSLLLQEYDNITVIDKPVEIRVGQTKKNPLGTHICMMPWICPDNYESSMELLQQTKATICCGHFEIAGFAMHRGMASEEGLDRALFRKFDFTFSGHYHHMSNADGIHYLGNPYELTWQDYNDARGFHVFDLDNHDLTFVQNPNTMFHRLSYDDKESTIKEITEMDMSKYTNTYVKVVVVNKTNPYLFDRFMEKLYQVNPIDVTIVEDFTDLTEGVDEDIIDQAEDTLTILNRYVDSVENEHIDNSVLKKILKELYVEAIYQDNV